MDESRGRLDGFRILVVDDEPETLEIIGHTLREAGAEVVEASSGGAALDVLAKRSDLHVVLSDLQMPELDGFELMARLRSRRMPIVAIALSASASLDDAKRALDVGFSVHVAKPIGMADLVESIRAAAPPPSLRQR